jgi:hypothetical protein
MSMKSITGKPEKYFTLRGMISFFAPLTAQITTLRNIQICHDKVLVLAIALSQKSGLFSGSVLYGSLVQPHYRKLWFLFF